MALGPRILQAKIMHRRLHPKANGFTYGAFYLVVPLSRLNWLSSRVFGVDRFGIMALHQRDHGPRDGSPLEPWMRALLARFGLAEADGEIVLVTLPRVLGYVFNPVSFWFCLDRAGEVRAVLSEVSNTFGEHHNYLCFHADHRPILVGDVLRSDKRFHVSPFLIREGHYDYEFMWAEDGLRVRIDHFDGEGRKLLITSLAGKTVPYSTAALLRAAIRHPLVSLKVIGLIHWQALKLFGRGIRYQRKPEALEEGLTASRDITEL